MLDGLALLSVLEVLLIHPFASAETPRSAMLSLVVHLLATVARDMLSSGAKSRD